MIMKHFYRKAGALIIVIFLVASNVIVTGILAGSLVKTPHGLVEVEQLAVGDYVIGYAHNGVINTRITTICTTVIHNVFALSTNKGALRAIEGQLFYDPVADAWIKAENITTNTVLLDSDCSHCTCIDIEPVTIDPTTVYHISTEFPNNFFVSEYELLTHNFAPVFVLGFSWVFGLGTIELSSIGVGLASLGAYVGYKFGKLSKHNQVNFTIESMSVSGGMMPEDPDDKNEERKKARENYEPLNNKRARQEADKLGYKEVKDHPCGDTHNKPVFFNGKEYISSDAYGHIGGMWKMFNRLGRRIGTYNIDLTKMIGK